MGETSLCFMSSKYLSPALPLCLSVRSHLLRTSSKERQPSLYHRRASASPTPHTCDHHHAPPQLPHQRRLQPGHTAATHQRRRLKLPQLSFHIAEKMLRCSPWVHAPHFVALEPSGGQDLPQLSLGTSGHPATCPASPPAIPRQQQQQQQLQHVSFSSSGTKLRATGSNLHLSLLGRAQGPFTSKGSRFLQE